MGKSGNAVTEQLNGGRPGNEFFHWCQLLLTILKEYFGPEIQYHRDTADTPLARPHRWKFIRNDGLYVFRLPAALQDVQPYVWELFDSIRRSCLTHDEVLAVCLALIDWKTAQKTWLRFQFHKSFEQMVQIIYVSPSMTAESEPRKK